MDNTMKPLVAAVIPLLTALGSRLTTGAWDFSQLSLAITGVATAIVVYVLGRIFPDPDTFLLAWIKAIGAAVTPLLSALIQSLATGSWSGTEWATAIVGVATAFLMAYVNNTPDT
jgi:hypothetical protein